MVVLSIQIAKYCCFIYYRVKNLLKKVGVIDFSSLSNQETKTNWSIAMQDEVLARQVDRPKKRRHKEGQGRNDGLQSMDV